MSDSKIALIFAGGEFVMRLDEGVVTTQSSVDGALLRSWVPAELIDSVEIDDWSHQPSSHYSVRMTFDLIQLAMQKVAKGASSVVICCGAGAVEEMVYLADLVWPYPQPLIFAAALRAPAVAGSDAITVLHEALRVTAASEAWGRGVIVCSGGRLFAANDVVQIASYGRCGFSGRFCESMGAIVGGKVLMRPAPQLRPRVFEPSFTPARKVEVLTAALGSGEVFLKLLTAAQPCPIDGLVVAGFGGGNVLPTWVSYLKSLIRGGIPVVVTSRCREGCVREDSSYEGSFQKLQEFGAFSGGFLTPLQARIKLAVGIGAGYQGEELQKYLLEA